MGSEQSVLDDYLGKSAYARLVGVSVEAVDAWLVSGKLPYVRSPLGRLIRKDSRPSHWKNKTPRVPA